MKTVTGALCVVCASLFLASFVHGDDSASVAGIVESLRAKAAAMESSMKGMEKELAAGREIRAGIDAEARGAGAAEKKEAGDVKAAAAAAKELARMDKTLAGLAGRAADLKKQIAAVESLRADLNKAVELKGQAEAKAAAAAAARQKAENDLAGARARIVAVEKQIDEMNAVVRSGRRLESDIAETIDERKEAEAEAAKTAADAKALAESIAAANKTLAGSQAQLAEAKKQVDADNALRAELEKEKQLIRDHEAAAKRTQSEVSSLKKELAAAQRDKAVVDKELAGLQDALKKQEQNPVHAELEKTRALRGEAEKLAAGFSAAREQAGRDLDVMKKGIDEADVRADEMEAQLKAGRRVISCLANEKKAREAALDRAEKEAKVVENIEREMLRLKTEIAQLEASSVEGEKQMEQLGSLQKELDEERKLKDASEARVKSALSAQSSLDKDLAKLKAQHDAARKEFERIEGRSRMLEQLRAELEDAGELKAASDARASEVEAARVVAEKNLTKLKAELSLQQEKNEEMSRAVRDARGLESEVARAKKLRADSEARLKKDGAKVASVEKEIAELEKRLEATVGEGTDGAAAVESAARLRGEIETEKKARDESERAIRELSESMSRMEKQKVSLLKDIASAEKGISRASEEIAELNAELAKEKKNNETLAGQMTEHQASVDLVDKEIAGLEKKIGELQTNLSAKSGKLDALPGLRDAIKKEQCLAAESEKKLDAIQSSRKSLDRRFASLNKDVAGIESKLAEAERELDGAGQLSAELERARVAREEAEARAGEGEQARDELESALKALKDKAKILGEAAERIADRQKSIASAPVAVEKADGPAVKPAADGVGATDILAEEERILASARSGDKQSSGASASEPKAMSIANASYQRGIARWDDGDIDGAIEDFNETIRLNPDAAGAYYNLGLAYLRKGDKGKSCDYGYMAGQCYLKHGNEKQAMRMVLFMKQVDQSSPLIEKLRQSIP